MKKTILHRGYHSEEVLDLVRRALEGKISLILVPPHLENLEHISKRLPKGTIDFSGHWENRPPLEAGPLEYDFSIGVFTSGTSSSNPKLVLLSKENIQASIESILKFFNDTKFDFIYCYPQPYHVFGVVLGYALSIVKQIDLRFFEGPYSTQAHEDWLVVANQNPNLITMGTPTHFKDLRNHLVQKQIAPPSTLTSIAGGALVDIKTWDLMIEDLKIKKPSVGYGCTEAAPGVTHLAPGLRPKSDGHLGKLIDSLEIELLPEEGALIRGKNVAHAVIDNGDLIFPKAHLIPDHLEISGAGDFYYKGRFNLILNRGGEKFPIEKIEAQLKGSLDLELACFAVDHQRLGEDLGIAVCRDLISISEEQRIKQSIQATLDLNFHRKFELENLIFVSKLPTNANSKVDRAALKELAVKISATKGKSIATTQTVASQETSR